MKPQKIELAHKLSLFQEHWSPKIIAEVNDCAAARAPEFDTAVPTGFEPAISSLTGTYARPLHHGTRLKVADATRLAPDSSRCHFHKKKGGECASFHSPPCRCGRTG